jgi:hypothetical protein
MSPQTETKASVGFKAGVKEYKLTYYTPEYETKDTDILAKTNESVSALGFRTKTTLYVGSKKRALYKRLISPGFFFCFRHCSKIASSDNVLKLSHRPS